MAWIRIRIWIRIKLKWILSTDFKILSTDFKILSTDFKKCFNITSLHRILVSDSEQVSIVHLKNK